MANVSASDSENDEDLAWVPRGQNPDGQANLLQVTIIASTAGLYPQPSELFMFGSSEALGQEDVPHAMRPIEHGPSSSLWEITVEMNGDDPPIHTSRALATVWFVAYGGSAKIYAGNRKSEKKITLPLRQRYFFYLGAPATSSSVAPPRSHIASLQKKTVKQDEDIREVTQVMNTMYDHILWDFERGAVRNTTDYAPIMSPAIFFESVNGLSRYFSNQYLVPHAMEVWNCKDLSKFEPGSAFSSVLSVTHVPADVHLLTMAAISSVLTTKKDPRRRRAMPEMSPYSGTGSASLDRRFDEDVKFGICGLYNTLHRGWFSIENRFSLQYVTDN